MSREEIINSDWYFAGDNKIIISYFKNNSKYRPFWDQTNKNIKFFIDKIKRLEPKKIKESFNIIQKRKDLIDEIKLLTIRMDRIFDDKKRIEFNKKQEDDLLKDINNQEEIFKDIEKTINKELSSLEELKENNKSIELEIKKNITFKKEKKKHLNQLNDKIKKMGNLTQKKIKVTKYRSIESDNYNVLCNNCHYNCHENCKCTLTGIHKYFCRHFTFTGNCRICHHKISEHKRDKSKFEK